MYAELAGGHAYWLSSNNTARNKKAFLQSKKMWDKAYNMTDIAYLDTADMAYHHRLWRMFYHEERWADTQSGVVAADHVIDIEWPHIEGSGTTLDDLYTTFVNGLRQALGVSLLPLPASLGGAGIPAEIAPGVTSATAGSSKTSAK